MKIILGKNVNEKGTYEHVEYFCKGCGHLHSVPVKSPDGGITWGFNRNVDLPTLTPSVKHTANYPDGIRICHYFITDGNFNYCSDSTHALAGQVVEMLDVKE
jgi:hypothetical protein